MTQQKLSPSLRLFTLAALFSVLAFTACRKSLPAGRLEQGQVALTFDDANVESWHRFLPLFDSLQIKATFYVSHYHTFSKQKKALLKEIAAHGHEIAYHTANHPDLAKEVAREGLPAIEEKEIRSDLRLLQADGYTITNFAYPFGSHNTQLNNCLLRTFKSVRCLSNQQDYRKSLVSQTGDRQIIFGANIDNNAHLKEDGIASLMDDARDHHSCLVLVAHDIDKPSIKLQISLDRIRFIARAAAERNLRFVSVNEVVK